MNSKTGVQLPQSNYGRLLLPYALMGLGRTNNYVEEFSVGVNRDQVIDYMIIEHL